MLCRDPVLDSALSGTSVLLPPTVGDIFRFRLKALAYNVLTSPYLYWLPAKLPFLGLGETRYKALDSVGPAEPILGEFLPANINEYWHGPDIVQTRLTALIADVSKGQMLDLFSGCCEPGRVQRLLRYPVLAADQSLRDRLFQALDREGLGVSKMYPASLPNIRGLESHLRVEGAAYPNAEAFARRILTFPVHSRVREIDLQRMHTCIRAVTGH